MYMYMYMYTCKFEILVDFNLAVAQAEHQIAKFYSYTVLYFAHTCTCTQHKAHSQTH